MTQKSTRKKMQFKGREVVVGALQHDIIRPLESILQALDDAHETLLEGGQSAFTDTIDEAMNQIEGPISTGITTAFELIRDGSLSHRDASSALKKHLITPFTNVSKEIENSIVPKLRSIEETSEYASEISLGLRKFRNVLVGLRRMSEGRYLPRNERTNLRSQTLDVFEFYNKFEQRALLEVHGEITIDGDSGQMFAIIDNFVSNAVRHTGKKELRISIRMSLVEPIKPAALRRHGIKEHAIETPTWVELTCRDFGVGIPKDQLGNVFKAGRQLKPTDYSDGNLADALKNRRTSLNYPRSSGKLLRGQNSGLGLSIVKFYVAQHGGLVAVDSMEGGPTTFAVWLPYQNIYVTSDSAEPVTGVWWRN